MILDLVVIALVALLAIVGAFEGALAQLVRLGALAVAAGLASPAGRLIAPHLARSVSPGLASLLATSLAFTALLIPIRWIGLRAARSITADGEIRAADRSTGALLGAAKALLIGYLLASVWVKAEDLAGRRWGTEGSFAAAAARALPLFEKKEGETSEDARPPSDSSEPEDP